MSMIKYFTKNDNVKVSHEKKKKKKNSNDMFNIVNTRMVYH